MESSKNGGQSLKLLTWFYNRFGIVTNYPLDSFILPAQNKVRIKMPERNFIKSFLNIYLVQIYCQRTS